ncbi:MAG: VOC family protein [Alphaproteobacteria bacterium]|nr:VOC family protein [Alphaproteobacteria bacterium]
MAAPRVKGLCGFGLEVPDLEVASAFYGAFGLEAQDHGHAVSLRSPGREQAEAVLTAGRDKKLHHVSFFIDPKERDAFAEKLKAAGLDVKETAPEGWIREGLWFEDPWGTWIHLNPYKPTEPESPPGPPSNMHGRAERIDVHLWQDMPKDRAPQRIGHMLMFTQEWEKTEAFYCDVLGFQTSDRVTDKVVFMSAGDGIIDHHCFGLINNTHRGIQHASFQVPSFDDIGFGAFRMTEAGYKEGFGPGRHALASNLFYYVRDPWGSWAEYYADMDKISPAWTAADFEVPPYVWGPEWSPEFWGGVMNANLEPAG